MNLIKFLGCTIDDMASKFAFDYLSKIELNELYGVDLPSQLELFPPFEIRSKLSQIPNLDDNDIDENFVQSIYSKYMDQLAFNNLLIPYPEVYHSCISI